MSTPRPPATETTQVRAGRNDPCRCGSGRKYKQCCGAARAFGMAELAPDLHRVASALAPAGPEPAERLMRRLAELRRAGRFADTLMPLRRLVLRDPANPRAHNDLGLTYRLCHQLPEAIGCFERAIALKPDYANAYYNLGVALEHQGRETAAIGAYRHSIAAAPKLADAHRKLAVLLVAQGATAEASACFARAAALTTDPVAKRVTRANELLFADELGEAEKWLRRALALAPRNAEIRRILGIVLQKRGDFEAASVEFEQAMALDPSDVSVYYYLTISKKIGETDRPLVDRMSAQLGRPDLVQRDRVGLNFGLGKAFDDLGDYAAAMRHFDEANLLVRTDLAFDRAGFAADNDRLIRCFTAARFAANRGLGAPDELPILIVGMPRSGTTLVEQIISAHPLVGAGDELEFWHRAPAFIDATSDEVDPTTVRRTGAEYCALLRRIAPQMLRVTDKMPANFRLLGPIHLALPQARIVHVRRQPIDTCLSNYFTWFSRAQSHAYDLDDLVFYYREYERLMTHWRTLLPAERLFEIDYEELITDREEATRRLIAFSGLDWDDACLRPESNDRLIKTASLWQARQPVYRTSVERWRRYEPWLGALRQLAPDAGPL